LRRGERLFRGAVVFPLAGPDGVLTGAMGRVIHPAPDEPKYKATAKADGYAKTLANGGVIARAVMDGGPVIVAGGLANVVAIGLTAYPWPEHFRGVARDSAPQQ